MMTPRQLHPALETLENKGLIGWVPGSPARYRRTEDREFSIARGEQARVLNNAPTKLVIFDDRYAMIPLQAAPATIASMILVHLSRAAYAARHNNYVNLYIPHGATVRMVYIPHGGTTRNV